MDSRTQVRELVRAVYKAVGGDTSPHVDAEVLAETMGWDLTDVRRAARAAIEDGLLRQRADQIGPLSLTPEGRRLGVREGW